MESRRSIKIMMMTITILLVITILVVILNIINIKNINNSTEYTIANSIGGIKNEIIKDTNILENDKEQQLTNMEQPIQELRKEINNSIVKVSSRSSINRQNAIEEMHINLNSNQEQEYEELIQYIKLEDVKISFDMDVSKTTGLSKDDFIQLVQNMKEDKTGILAKNAGWIWECCQTYNVNEIFILGVCGIESNWCLATQHQITHNYASLMSGGKLIQYPSDEAGFEATIKLLGQKYLTPGASLYHGSTITGVGKCYCNPTSWPKKVYTCMQKVFS